MTLFLKILFGSGCLGALLAAFYIASMFLFESGGGNWISGLAVEAVLVFGGATAGVFFILGLAGALGMYARKDARYLHWFGWFTGGLLALALAVFVVGFIKDALKENQTRREQEAWEKGNALVASILADPAKLEAYSADHGLDVPLPGTAQTPLEGAVAKGYKDLVEKFLAQGAKVTDNALTAAAHQGDAGTVLLLLEHGKISDNSATIQAREGIGASISFMQKNPQVFPLSGLDALAEAYSQGREDILRLLISHGAQTNSLAVQLAYQDKYLQFFPGDLDWKALLRQWGDKSACPPAILDSLESARSTQQASASPSEEKLAVDTLNFTLQSDQFYADPKVRFKKLPIEAWMKEVPSPGWNNSPLIRRINRAILEALYPGAIATGPKAKGFSMFLLLVKNVRAKSGEGGRVILRTAIADRDADLVGLLLEEGFDLHTIQSEITSSSFLDVPDDRRMKSYLLQKGMHL
jgi:hypothetical protein